MSNHGRASDLGGVFSSLRGRLARKTRAIARLAGPVIIPRGLQGFTTTQDAMRRGATSPARACCKFVSSKLLAAIALLAASTVPSHAQTTNWGGQFSSNWFFGPNWINGIPQRTFDVNINTVTQNATVVASPGAEANNLSVGANGTGMLTIQNGGTLVDQSGAVGNLPGGAGTMIVTGAGSSWTNVDNIVVGGLGTGTFTIQNGGSAQDGTTASSTGGSIGQSAGSTGTVMVTGAGSSWINGPSGGFNIGSFGTGTLTIANGGRVIDITPLVTNIGNGAGSHGTVTVTGAGSLWSDIAGIRIGNLGTGALTIADSGNVIAPIVTIAANAGSTGTLNIGAGAGDPAAAPGTLTAPSVAFGAGTGTINFNHTSADYVFAPAISGGGTVNVLAGTTILTADNSYTGGTKVSGGTLAVGDFAHPSAALSGGGPITVGSGGTLGGYGSVTGPVTNSGVIAPGSATPGFSGSPMGAFTINGNYTGVGGTMAINTVLGGDGSPSDKLVISSAGTTATGNTTVRVTNVGGGGAETTGNGIQVVSAVGGATTAPGAFALPAGELRAGAFDYDLFRGGVSGSPNDWFLRSDFIARRWPRWRQRQRRWRWRWLRADHTVAAGDEPADRPAPEPAAARRRLSDHRAGTRNLWRRAASGAPIGAQHPRHARRPGRRYLRAGRLRCCACGRAGCPTDQEAGASACTLPVVFALGLGPLLRPNNPQQLSSLRRSQRQRQSGRLPGRDRSSARISDRRSL